MRAVVASIISSHDKACDPLGCKWTNMVGGESIRPSVQGNKTGVSSSSSFSASSTVLSPALEDWIQACTPLPSTSSSSSSSSSSSKAAAASKGETQHPPLHYGALFAYCPGKVSAFLSPRDAVCLNLKQLALLVISDMGLSDASYRRQNSVDNLKTPHEVRMEDPLSFASILSLAGAGSLVINRSEMIIQKLSASFIQCYFT